VGRLLVELAFEFLNAFLQALHLLFEPGAAPGPGRAHFWNDRGRLPPPAERLENVAGSFLESGLDLLLVSFSPISLPGPTFCTASGSCWGSSMFWPSTLMTTSPGLRPAFAAGVPGTTALIIAPMVVK